MALKRICLDTSAYSHFKRGDSQAVATISSAREVFVPTVVLGELRTGFLLGSHTKRNQTELDAFLAAPVVQTIAIDDGISAVYAELVVALRREGTPLPTNDIWIAASAITIGTVLLTYDTHFERIQRLGVRILPIDQ